MRGINLMISRLRSIIEIKDSIRRFMIIGVARVVSPRTFGGAFNNAINSLIGLGAPRYRFLDKLA